MSSAVSRRVLNVLGIAALVACIVLLVMGQWWWAIVALVAFIAIIVLTAWQLVRSGRLDDALATREKK